jgi:hypothetical protein
MMLPPKRLRRLPPEGGAACGRAEPAPRLQLGFGIPFLAEIPPKRLRLLLSEEAGR